MRFGMAVLTAAALALAGCGSFSCSDAGSCKNDVAPSSTAVASCNAALADKACGDQVRTLDQCLQDHEQCDPQGNRDSLSTVGKCTGPYADVQSCCARNPSSAACSAS